MLQLGNLNIEFRIKDRDVRNLDPRYFNDNYTQSLIRISLNSISSIIQGSLSLAKTQGSVYIRVNRQIILN